VRYQHEAERQCMPRDLAYHTAGFLHTTDALAAGHPGLVAIGFPLPQADGKWRFPEFSSSRRRGTCSRLTTAENPAVVPYYRDDSCLDDGTGDNPVPRPWPGESSDDTRVTNGYCAAGKPNGCHVCRSATDTGPCDVDCKLGQTQGAYAAHGIHYFFSSDTDNLQSPEALTEIDAQQWQFMVPTQQPTNVGESYGDTVITPLQTQ